MPYTAISKDSITRIEYALVYLFMLSLYTYVPITIGDLKIPPLLPSLFAITLFFTSCKGRVKKSTATVIALFLLLALISIVFSPSPLIYLGERTKGFLYFTLSIVTAASIQATLSRWDRTQISRMMSLLTILILTGCFMENYLGLRALSDTFREAIIKTDVYVSDARDINTSGMIRPKLFTAEPSFVAIFLVFTISNWYYTSNERQKSIIFVGFFGLAAFLVRSPIIFLLLLVYTAGSVKNFSSEIKGRALNNKLLLLPFLLLLLVAATFSAQEIISQRLNEILELEDASFLIRIVVPILVTQELMQTSPMFGAGISGYEYLEEIIYTAFRELGIHIHFDIDEISRRIVNIFWAIFINFGLFGGVIFILLFHKLTKNAGVSTKANLFIYYSIVIVYTQIMGGFNGVRFWSMALITALSFVSLGASNQLKGEK